MPILIYGSHKIEFTDVLTKKFPVSSIPIEFGLRGYIAVKLIKTEREREEKPAVSYSVALDMGDKMGVSLGHFREEGNARRVYDLAVKALEGGGKLRVRAESPIEIVAASGALACESTYDRENEFWEDKPENRQG